MPPHLRSALSPLHHGPTAESAMSELAPRFRRYEEDDAEVWFSPETGINVRFETERTRGARRRVPRAVMFGITNRCNLRCDFCSRDTRAESHWSVQSAAQLLEDLANEGVLEVAFGGGEPFAFAGFDVLLSRLRRTTRLALSVTTNGTLLTAERWARFAGSLSMVRLSLYPETDWHTPARVLQRAGQRWGANVLVDDQNVHQLAPLLEALAAEGAHDVSLLSYVGVPTRLLTLGARQALARTIERSPLPCRLSVCMGDSVPVHRLWDGATRDGDCGAGVDFVSISSDGMMAPCSFHQTRVRIESARDVLRAYLLQRIAFLAPSTRSGCARSVIEHGSAIERSSAPDTLTTQSPALRPAVAVWQAYSGNNSGECVLAAKFSEEPLAQAFFEALRGAWIADEEYPDAWRELFAAEQISVPDYREASISMRRAPEEFARFGRTVIATGGGVDDVFPELRALAFRKHALVAPGGIHIHETATLLLGVRARAEVARCAEAAMREGFGTLRHGELVFMTHPLADLPDLEARVQRVAAGRPYAVEVVMRKLTREALDAAAKQLGSPASWRPRMVVSFAEWPKPTDKNDALLAGFVRSLGNERHTRVGSQLWFDTYRGSARIAVAAMRRGASVERFSGEALRLHAYAFLPLPWIKRRVTPRKSPSRRTTSPETPSRTAGPAEAKTRGVASREAGPRDVIACASEWRAIAPHGAGVMAKENDLHVEFASSTPEQALLPLAASARRHALGFAVHVREIDDVLVALRHLREALG